MDKLESLSSFVVVINSTKELEYFRDRLLSRKQLHDLETIDTKLDNGLHLDGELINKPTESDKAIFIALQLVHSLEKENETAISLSCAYLATRYKYLKQLKVLSHEGQISIELIYDKEFVDQTPLKYIAKKDLC